MTTVRLGKPGYVDLSHHDDLRCAQCGSPMRHVPVKEPEKFRDALEWIAFMKEAVKGLCPHCTPLPTEKWPEWRHGRLVKGCGCGSPTCPVPEWAARDSA